MSAAPLSCPYCNAFVPLPAGARSGQRLPCPRCGEAFAYHGPDAEAVTSLPSAPLPAPLNLSAGPAVAASRRPNWLVAVSVLGIMAVMAVVGLLYALRTETVRREHDWRLPKDRSLPLYLTVFAGVWLAGLVGVALWEVQSRYRRTADAAPRRVPWGVALGVITVVAAAGVGLAVLAVRINENRASRSALTDAPPPVRVVAPADLAGLAYLPEGTDVVAAVHVAEALQEPTGKEFLARFRFGNTGIGLERVEGWTGLKAEELDHFALGLRAEGTLMPAWLVLVVRTRRPYDAGKLRDALDARRLPHEGRKELYRFQPKGAASELVLWCPDERTLLLGGLMPGGGVTDFKKVPDEPHQGTDHLPPEVRAYLKERLGQGTQAWVVGHVADWQKTFLHFWLGRSLKEDPESQALLGLRTFGLSFQFRAEELIFNANLRCADEKATVALQNYFQQPKAGRKRPGIITLPPELAGVSRELGQRMSVVRNEDWLLFQAKAAADALPKAAPAPPR